MLGKLIILGAGGHGKVVAELAVASGWNVCGFIDPAMSPGQKVGNFYVLNSGKDLYEDASWLREHDFFPAIGHGETRWRELVRLISHGAKVPMLAHPSSLVSESAIVEGGSVIMAGAIVQASCNIGAGTIINTGASVDHDCVVGSGVMIGPGAVLCGGVHVGDHSFISAGAVLVPGIRLGRGVFVGAGTTVVDNLLDGAQHKAVRRTYSFS